MAPAHLANLAITVCQSPWQPYFWFSLTPSSSSCHRSFVHAGAVFWNTPLSDLLMANFSWFRSCWILHSWRCPPQQAEEAAHTLGGVQHFWHQDDAITGQSKQTLALHNWDSHICAHWLNAVLIVCHIPSQYISHLCFLPLYLSPWHYLGFLFYLKSSFSTFLLLNYMSQSINAGVCLLCCSCITALAVLSSESGIK